MPDRRRWVNLLRAAFLLAVAAFIGWSMRGRWGEVADGFAAIGWWSSLAALVLFVLGLGITGVVWADVLAGFGHRLSLVEAFSVFFPGQLGKYVPGSVWSFGVQAHLARDHQIPVRFTVTTSLVFLGYCLTSAGLIGGTLGLSVPSATNLPAWALALCLLGSMLGSHPKLIGLMASRVAGTPISVTWVEVGRATLLSLAAWAAYLLGVVVLTPHLSPTQWAALGVALVLSFVAGVVVFLAPAGLGAREATFVAIASAAVGLGTATAIALATRILFLIGDVGLAAGSWLLGRRTS